MPSSQPEDWGRLFDDLRKHETERQSLGTPAGDAASRIVEIPNIPRYEILERLGEGSSAVIFRAMDRELRRPVALKIQRPGVGRSEIGRQRFRREAQTLAGLAHPHVVMIHDAGEAGGQLYLVMELVDGRPLSDLMTERKNDLRGLTAILEKAARGVSAAHEKGIVHRDLKPANILVTASGEPKVADFGLAHLVDSESELTRTGSSLGTPLYMSPEQVEGKAGAISPRTDVFALGTILYEILTGQAPHPGETLMEIYGRIIRNDPVPPKRMNPNVPADLQTIVLKCLEKDPRRRYPTAKEFADDLKRHLAGEPIEARPAGFATRTCRVLLKSRPARGIGIVAAAILVAAVGIEVAGREKAGRLRAEQEKRLNVLREHARTSLSAVLKLRRAGANDAMKEFVPALEAAYAQALETAPQVAEVEYLLGRMHRALLEDTKALDFQERALKKEPRYAPALYERAVLMANRYGSALTRAVAEARRLPPGVVTARESREAPFPDPLGVEGSRQELVAVRDRILRDCTVLEELLAHRSESEFRQIGEAHILTVKGILAYYRLEWVEGRKLLAEAVRKDPTLEEAWAALCETAYRQTNAEARRSTDADALLRQWAETEKLYDSAIANDRGYVPHWIGRADMKRHRAFALMRRGQDAIPAFEEAEADLARALELRRDSPDAFFLRGSIGTSKGVCLMDRGRNPVKDLEAAGAYIRSGLALSGDRASGWMLKGSLHNEWARWRRRCGESPLADYAAAEEAFGRALQIDPDFTQARGARAITRTWHADYQSRHGVDPLPEFAAAEEDIKIVIQTERQAMDSWQKRAQLYFMRAQYRIQRGESPIDDLKHADEDFSEAIRLNPGNEGLYCERGESRLHLGRLQEKSGDLPQALRWIQDAVADFTRAFERVPSLQDSFAGQFREAKARLQALAPGK
jgi:serine/threonine-protein kinase